jgi:hypothetical protein
VKKLTSAVNFGLEPGRGRVMVVGTPLAGDCIVVRLSQHPSFRARWTSLRFRASDEAGVVLYQAKWSTSALRDEELEDPEAYASELDDRPPQQQGNPFGEPTTYEPAELPTGLPKILAYDPSYGMTENSDLQGLVVLRGPTPEGVWYVTRVEATRIGDPQAQVDHVNRVWAEEQPDLAMMETIALGQLIEAMSVSSGRAVGVFPGWLRISRHDAAKEVRIRGLAPLWNSGRIRVPADRTCRVLEHQARDYGDSGTKVDVLDVLEMAIRHAQHPRITAHHLRHRPRERAFGVGAW